MKVKLSLISVFASIVVMTHVASATEMQDDVIEELSLAKTNLEMGKGQLLHAEDLAKQTQGELIEQTENMHAMIEQVQDLIEDAEKKIQDFTCPLPKKSERRESSEEMPRDKTILVPPNAPVKKLRYPHEPDRYSWEDLLVADEEHESSKVTEEQQPTTVLGGLLSDTGDVISDIEKDEESVITTDVPSDLYSEQESVSRDDLDKTVDWDAIWKIYSDNDQDQTVQYDEDVVDPTKDIKTLLIENQVSMMSIGSEELQDASSDESIGLNTGFVSDNMSADDDVLMNEEEPTVIQNGDEVVDGNRVEDTTEYVDLLMQTGLVNEENPVPSERLEEEVHLDEDSGEKFDPVKFLLGDSDDEDVEMTTSGDNVESRFINSVNHEEDIANTDTDEVEVSEAKKSDIESEDLDEMTIELHQSEPELVYGASFIIPKKPTELEEVVKKSIHESQQLYEVDLHSSSKHSEEKVVTTDESESGDMVRLEGVITEDVVCGLCEEIREQRQHEEEN